MHVVCWTIIERTRQGSKKLTQNFKLYDSLEEAKKAIAGLTIADADNGIENSFIAQVIEEKENG